MSLALPTQEIRLEPAGEDSVQSPDKNSVPARAGPQAQAQALWEEKIVFYKAK
jgi:hypothetical protein